MEQDVLSWLHLNTLHRHIIEETGEQILSRAATTRYCHYESGKWHRKTPRTILVRKELPRNNENHCLRHPGVASKWAGNFCIMELDNLHVRAEDSLRDTVDGAGVEVRCRVIKDPLQALQKEFWPLRRRDRKPRSSWWRAAISRAIGWRTQGLGL